ncbi:hypothetical protein L6164_008274 [Bauhinia variegata]|uniref:Uncharacterized protein n=1 Tax=Bauhinia variegata TaxID=167791 RepID=A0ACB9PHD7_BAUVA|nr:hypothetical protein L6164_008274 [Bauhinia variegata]
MAAKGADNVPPFCPWRNGKGDVVQDFVNAAKARKIDVGLYLSPWDKHDHRYGHDLPYNEYYLAQLQELLNKYGSVREIWFDGAKGSNAPNMSYYFSEWFSIVKELQSSINIFSDAGPNVSANITIYLSTGDPRGIDWIPAECNVSIRKGWFWHKSESPKKLSELLDIYYNSVGRNCVMLLNVPPNTTGLASDNDAQRLREFRGAINKIFDENLAQDCYIKVSSQRGGFGPEKMLDGDHLWTYWAPRDDDNKKDYRVEIRGKDGGLLRFNVIRIQEAIGLGQRIERHQIHVHDNLIIKGTTVGYKRLHRIEGGWVHAHLVRIRITRSRGVPLISSIGLHFDPFWHS